METSLKIALKVMVLLVAIVSADLVESTQVTEEAQGTSNIQASENVQGTGIPVEYQDSNPNHTGGWWCCPRTPVCCPSNTTRT